MNNSGFNQITEVMLEPWCNICGSRHRQSTFCIPIYSKPKIFVRTGTTANAMLNIKNNNVKYATNYDTNIYLI